ncbi:MAG: phosphatase PAP2 family protein [Bacteroidota bacterium]
MTEFLYDIDVSIFYFLNVTISNSIFDIIFAHITNVTNWFLVYFSFWLILIFKGGRIGKISAFGIILVIAISDQISSHLLKQIFERVRPCNVLNNVHLLVNCTKSYSMPSSHAVNNFAAAIFFGKLFPKYKVPLILIAVFMALSRPIVGVHYFSDIFVGALIGIIIGYLMALTALKIDELFEKRLKTVEK